MSSAAPLLLVALLLCVTSCGRPGAGNGAPDPVPDGGSSVGQPSGEASTCPHVPVEAKCKDGFCLIPAGCFVKGTPPTEPHRARYGEEQHEVTLSQSFVMQDHETTQAEWEALGFKNLAGTKVNSDGGKDCTEPTCPASLMTWFEATMFANEKSRREGLPACIELTGCTGEVGVDLVCTGYRQTTPSYYECRGYRLPTMFEFEYAKRAGTTTTFYTGPSADGMDQCVRIPHLDDAAWYCVNSGNTTHPVKLKKPNAWGLYDMMGNAAELVTSNPDIFDIAPKPATDPQSKLDDSGTFGNTDGPYFSWPGLLRSGALPRALYHFNPLAAPRNAGVALGFRLVRTVSASEAAAWR